MSAGPGSAPDPFVLRDLFDPALYGIPNRNTDGLTAVYPNLVSGETTCVILAGGQSTIANSGNGTYTKTNSKIHCLNIYNGGMYSAVNPLLGVTGTGENFLIRLADKMITAGKYQRVILVPLAIGSTNASNWAVGGFVNERLGVAALRTLALGLTPTYFIWQQGEADCALGTSQSSFSNSLTSIISTIRGPLPTTPIYISQTTMQNSITSSAIRAAQAAAVGGTVFAGPDTDSLTGGNRQGDGTHFTATGNDALAGLWNAKLA